MKKTLFLFFILNFLLLAQQVNAARLYFAPAPATTEGEYAVSAFLDTTASINVIEGSVIIPESVSYLRTSDGGSIVSLWVEGALFDPASHSISFAGVIPGGFTGSRGKILTVYFSPKEGSEQSTGGFSFDAKKTKLYENTGEPKEAPLQIAPLALSQDFFKKAENLNEDAPAPDTRSPETFNAAIARDPEIFDGKYYVVFAAKDSESGIAGYEVAEGGKSEVSDYVSLEWRPATSPFVLRDQTRSVYIYVKAIDNAGNERVVSIPPAEEFSPSFFESAGLFLSIILTIGVLLALVFSAYKYYATRNSITHTQA